MVHASTLLAWNLRVLLRWDIPCDAPQAAASGVVVSPDPAPRIDLSSLSKTPAERVWFLGLTLEGVVFGLFAHCPLSGDIRQRRDPALKSAMIVLEHPTSEQRKWQLQDPNCEVTVNEGPLGFGVGFCVNAAGYLCIGPHPRRVPRRSSG
jgi:hypothetical protein